MSSGIVKRGEPLTVSYNYTGTSNLRDWIGLFPVGATPSKDNFGVWRAYVTPNTTSGSFSTLDDHTSSAWVVPEKGGAWEFMYLLGDGYFIAMKSAPVVVAELAGTNRIIGHEIQHSSKTIHISGLAPRCIVAMKALLVAATDPEDQKGG